MLKSVYDNFASLSDKDKKGMLLYGDSRLDRIKNKFILEATLRILTAKKHRQIKLHGHLSTCDIKSTLYKRFLN